MVTQPSRLCNSVLMPKCYTIFFYILLAAFSARATGIKGHVTDNKGESLPYATVYVEGTTLGVTTNASGDYELSLEAGSYKVICRYVGFRASVFPVTISAGQTVTHSFVLEEESTQMAEVVVRASDEDPAYKTIREAIRRRKFHLDQVHSFQSRLYFKGVMRSRSLPAKFMGQEIKSAELGVDSAGKGVLYLTEEDAHYYSDGNREKTVIHSVHESGDKNGLGFSQFPSVLTFYENNVRVLEGSSRGFISPISDNALTYYKYKLLATFEDGGYIVNKIEVTPKRAFEPCFTGTIYIAEREWNIHSLDLTLYKRSGMDMLDTLRVEQVFLPLKEDTWVVKSQVLSLAVKFLMFDVTGSGVAVYNEQKVNEPIPDSVFAGRVVSQYDKNANKQDSTFWEHRPVPLAADEGRDFVAKDSISKVVNSPEYIDSVRRKQNMFKPIVHLLRERTYNGRAYKHSVTFNPVLLGLKGENAVNYNSVEGLNIAPRVNMRFMTDTGKYVMADVIARYGFANEHFNAAGRVYRITQDRAFLSRMWLYGVEGGKYVYQYNPVNPVVPMFNSLRTLLVGENDLKIYERWDASAFIRRNYGTGIAWMVKASWQRRMPLSNSTNYTFDNSRGGSFTSNSPLELLKVATAWEQHDAALLKAVVWYKPGFTYTQFPDYKMANGSRWPTFMFSYQQGIPNLLGSKVQYGKWRFSVRDETSLKLLGKLKYNFAIGGFLDTQYVSFPDLMHLNGMRGVGYAAPYLSSFQFAPYYQFSNKARLYGEAHLEHHLNGLLSNKIPLLRQARYYLLFGGNAFFINERNYYAEAFAGVDNIGWKLVRIFRIDFVQSWDSIGGHNSGIRVGVNLRWLSTAQVSATDSEW